MFLVINRNKIISILSIVAIVVIVVSIYSSIAVPTNSSSQKLLPIYNVETKDKKVALTINCAWDDSDIDTILETLNKCNVKLTFFVVGTWIDKYPESLKKIYDNGHEIANHSDTHPHVNKMSLEENIKQIENCSKKVKNITGNETSLYRGPYGEYNNTVINASINTKHQAIQWNIDSLDYKGLTKDEMISRINKKLSAGSIILMHSGAENTASSLEDIIKNIQNKGYQLVKVSDLIYADNFYINIQGTQIKK